RRVFAVPLDIVLAPADVEPHIAAVAPAQLLEGLLEHPHGRRTLGGVARRHIRQHADAPHLIGLRLRRPWPRYCSAAEKPDEFPSPHGFALARTASGA